MDVRAFGSWMSTPKRLFFPGFRGPHRSFCPRTSAGISAWTSAGYLAPKLTLWAAAWAAANGGVTNGGLRGVWPPFLEISRNWPKSPFFCLFRPFPEGAKSTWKIPKTEEKGRFPQISSDLLKPPSLKPPFAALQSSFLKISDKFPEASFLFFVFLKLRSAER